MIFLLAIYLNLLVSYSSSKSRKSFIYGVLNLACAQKIGTGHFKNGSAVNFSSNQLCLQTAQSPFVQAWFCPMSKLLQEPTLTLCASVRGGVWTCFEQTFCLSNGGNCEVLTPTKTTLRNRAAQLFQAIRATAWLQGLNSASEAEITW